MEATDLQNRLARSVSGETLLLSIAAVEEAFSYERTSEERRTAAARLASWYRCCLTVRGLGESQILFTRHENLSPTNSA
jgi:hypothetical protein